MDIFQALKTSTFRQSAITSTSTMISAILGAFFYFILAKTLYPAEYGQFSLAITLIPMLAGVLDLGTSKALIKFIPSHKTQDQKFALAKTILFLKLAIGITGVVALWIFASPLSVYLLRQPDLAPLMPLVGVGILSQLLFSFSIYLLQALEKYKHWGSLLVGTNLLRLLALIFLIYIHRLNPTSALALFALLPLLGFIVSCLFIDTRTFSSHFSPKFLSQIFSFNKWLTLSSLITAVSSRLDIIFTGRLLSLVSTGVYTLSTQMVAPFPQLVTAVSAVTTSKFASFTSTHHNRQYVKKAVLLNSFIGFFLAIVLIPIALIVVWFTGEKYIQAIIPFLILLAGQILFFSITPLQDSILYFYGKSSFTFIIGSVSIIALISLNQILIPKLGIPGAALAVLINIAIISLITLWYYHNRVTS